MPKEVPASYRQQYQVILRGNNDSTRTNITENLSIHDAQSPFAIHESPSLFTQSGRSAVEFFSNYESLSNNFIEKNGQAVSTGENNPASASDCRNAHQNATNINWDVATSSKELHIVGEPCPKPSSGSLVVNERIAQNLRRVASNIRRRKMIICILIFSFMLIWGGFYDVFIRIHFEKDDVFSVRILKPWLYPGLICEMVLTGIGIIVLVVKMKFMKNRIVKIVYRLVVGFNSFRHLLLVITLPIGIYFFFTELSAEMRQELAEGDMNNIPVSWNRTQSERKCCGLHNRTDWVLPEYIAVEDDDDDDDYDEPSNGLNNETAFFFQYPVSCCNITVKNVRKEVCTESTSHRIWKEGCHDVEFYIVLDYILSLSGLLLISFSLNIAIKFGIFKLERYLLVFRSYDYEYLGRVYSQAGRNTRSQTAKNAGLDDGLYLFESVFNHLYITARNGRLSPGPVVLKEWSDSGSQLWGVRKFETNNPNKGYNMKPLANEFNFVTSTLKNNAHAYNAWVFKKQTSPHTYTVANILDKKCLQTASLNERVRFEKCQPVNKKQHWKLTRVD